MPIWDEMANDLLLDPEVLDPKFESTVKDSSHVNRIATHAFGSFIVALLTSTETENWFGAAFMFTTVLGSLTFLYGWLNFAQHISSKA